MSRHDVRDFGSSKALCRLHARRCPRATARSGPFASFRKRYGLRWLWAASRKRLRGGAIAGGAVGGGDPAGRLSAAGDRFRRTAAARKLDDKRVAAPLVGADKRAPSQTCDVDLAIRASRSRNALREITTNVHVRAELLQPHDMAVEVVLDHKRIFSPVV